MPHRFYTLTGVSPHDTPKITTLPRPCPQGSAISPLLANLFLHYAFDGWMAREFPSLPFERYCDDIVVHCFSEKQTRHVGRRIAARLGGLGLQLHPDKTRIVYCQQDGREDSYEHTSFTFLGYTFRKRTAQGAGGICSMDSCLPSAKTRRGR